MSLHGNDRPTSRNALGSHPYDFGVHGMHDVVVENIRDGEVGAEISAFVDGARSVPAGGCGRGGRLHGVSGGGISARFMPGTGK